mmetsp:Transcript_178547/g.572270  ORF Transcript_178547/g.572270 Transcript_178547/m.572270 type:complete len:335 (-) Transcript_178547:619-1623(-)
MPRPGALLALWIEQQPPGPLHVQQPRVPKGGIAVPAPEEHHDAGRFRERHRTVPPTRGRRGIRGPKRQRRRGGLHNAVDWDLGREGHQRRRQGATGCLRTCATSQNKHSTQDGHASRIDRTTRVHRLPDGHGSARQCLAIDQTCSCTSAMLTGRVRAVASEHEGPTIPDQRRTMAKPLAYTSTHHASSNDGLAPGRGANSRRIRRKWSRREHRRRRAPRLPPLLALAAEQGIVSTGQAPLLVLVERLEAVHSAANAYRNVAKHRVHIQGMKRRQSARPMPMDLCVEIGIARNGKQWAAYAREVPAHDTTKGISRLHLLIPCHEGPRKLASCPSQ